MQSLPSEVKSKQRRVDTLSLLKANRANRAQPQATTSTIGAGQVSTTSAEANRPVTPSSSLIGSGTDAPATPKSPFGIGKKRLIVLSSSEGEAAASPRSSGKSTGRRLKEFFRKKSPIHRSSSLAHRSSSPFDSGSELGQGRAPSPLAQSHRPMAGSNLTLGLAGSILAPAAPVPQHDTTSVQGNRRPQETGEKPTTAISLDSDSSSGQGSLPGASIIRRAASTAARASRPVQESLTVPAGIPSVQAGAARQASSIQAKANLPAQHGPSKEARSTLPTRQTSLSHAQGSLTIRPATVPRDIDEAEFTMLCRRPPLEIQQPKAGKDREITATLRSAYRNVIDEADPIGLHPDRHISVPGPGEVLPFAIPNVPPPKTASQLIKRAIPSLGQGSGSEMSLVIPEEDDEWDLRDSAVTFLQTAEPILESSLAVVSAEAIDSSAVDALADLLNAARLASLPGDPTSIGDLYRFASQWPPMLPNIKAKPCSVKIALKQPAAGRAQERLNRRSPWELHCNVGKLVQSSAGKWGYWSFDWPTWWTLEAIRSSHSAPTFSLEDVEKAFRVSIDCTATARALPIMPLFAYYMAAMERTPDAVSRQKLYGVVAKTRELLLYANPSQCPAIDKQKLDANLPRISLTLPGPPGVKLVTVSYSPNPPKGIDRLAFLDKAHRLAESIFRLDERWDLVSISQKWQGFVYYMEQVVIPALDAEAAGKSIDSRPLGDPATICDKTRHWLKGSAKKTGLSGKQLRKAVSRRAIWKFCETPGASQLSARGSLLGIYCRKSQGTRDDYLFERNYQGKLLVQDYPRELLHKRTRFEDVSMASPTLCLVHLALDIIVRAKAVRQIKQSIRHWSDFATVKQESIESVMTKKWPTPQNVLIRPLPHEATAKEQGDFVRDVGCLSPGVQHPWSVSSYESFALARSRSMARSLVFDKLVSWGVRRAWDIIATVKSSWPSFDKVHHLTRIESKLVQHHPANLQVLDVFSNRAKGTSTAREADLVFYAILIHNLARKAIGNFSANCIIDEIHKYLVSVVGPPSDILAKLTSYGQAELYPKGEALGGDLLRATAAVGPLHRVEKRIPLSSENPQSPAAPGSGSSSKASKSAAEELVSISSSSSDEATPTKSSATAKAAKSTAKTVKSTAQTAKSTAKTVRSTAQAVRSTAQAVSSTAKAVKSTAKAVKSSKGKDKNNVDADWVDLNSDDEGSDDDSELGDCDDLDLFGQDELDEAEDSPPEKYLFIHPGLSSEEVIRAAVKGYGGIKVDQDVLNRFSTAEARDSLESLLESMLGNDRGQVTFEGLPTLGFIPPHWTLAAIMACLAYWIKCSDGCEKRPICPPPPVGPIGPVKPVEEPPKPEKKTLQDDSKSQWFGEDRDRIKACLAQDFLNPIHFYGFLIRCFGKDGPLRDHISHLPLDMWSRSSISRVTRIAHRIHGLYFCWGWPVEFPTSGHQFVYLACNVQVERRFTNWWRGARRGAALFDWLARWKPFLATFVRGGPLQGILPEGMLLNQAELAAIERSDEIQYADSVDDMVYINVFNHTETSVWYRQLYGTVDSYGKLPTAKYDPNMSVSAKKSAQLQSTTALRVQKLIDSGAELPWKIRSLHEAKKNSL